MNLFPDNSLYIIIGFLIYMAHFSLVACTRDELDDNLIDPNCRCCGQSNGRYCGSELNQLCSTGTNSNKCVPNSIYFCYSTYTIAQRVRYCPGERYGSGGCVQISRGSSRCA